jgi:uncharacterized protein (DUF1501 family)
VILYIGELIMLTRRDFLRSSSLLALAPAVPLFIARTARAATADKNGHVLVVVQLDGGNDALNTVVPHADAGYEKLRPTLRVAKKDLVKLTDTLGLHPALKPLGKLLDAGHLAVLPGVGYPNPNRSHFESMAIWHTARFDDEELRSYGWLGRALDPSAGTAYMVGGAVPTALRGRRSSAVALGRIEDILLTDRAAARQSAGPEANDDLLAFVRRQAVDAQVAADKLARLNGADRGARYPGTGLAERLKLMARLLKADLGARVFYTAQSGYDTHANQRFTHAGLLNEFAGGVAAFFDDLQAAKLADRVTLIAFSEFGRTIKENGSAGTDHGTAGVVFVAGLAVTGGMLGSMPNLTELDRGEPKMTTDFRRVYATVLNDWLGLSTDGLGGTFEALPLFRAPA